MKTGDYLLRQRSFYKTPAEKKSITEVLKRVLEARPDVCFAYLYGSFLEDRPFHDVDIAVWWEGDGGFADRALELAEAAERALREAGHPLPVDIRTLNHAPLGFRYHVFRGQPLLCRDEELEAREVVWAIARYLDLKPLLRRALKEAVREWASTTR